MSLEILLGAYVFMLALLVGIEVVGRVPSILHTPLMSGTNAIHGIVVVGAILVTGHAENTTMKILGFIAIILGSGNAIGGLVVTDRMLQMFQKKPGSRGAA